MAVHSTNIQPETVLITGCSEGGIGSALAEALAERGLHVFATAPTLSKMSHLEQWSNITRLKLDVTDDGSVKAAVAAVRCTPSGKLNYLFNIAGRACVRPALDTDLDDAKNVIGVNLLGIVRMIHMFAPLIIPTKGTIVNISSIAAVLHPAWGGVYNASKAAVKAYSETLRLEMKPFGVKVITVMAGIVNTKIFENHPKDELPSDSLYQDAWAEILQIASGSLRGMPPSEFAEHLVNEILSGKAGLIWAGRMSQFARFLEQWVPQCLADFFMTYKSGLSRVGKGPPPQLPAH